MSQENQIWQSGSNIPIQVTDRLTSVGSLAPDRFHALGGMDEASTKRLQPSGAVQTSGPLLLNLSLFHNVSMASMKGFTISFYLLNF